jgi:sugar phosphate isomerase/epimerase
LTIYVSTSCLKDCRDLSRVLDLYSGAGIRNVELGSCHGYIEGVQEMLERYDSTNFILHNYFPPARESFIMNLASQDKRIRSQSLNVCRNAICLCGRLGAPLYSFHPGFRVEGTLDKDFGLSNAVVPYEKAFKTFTRSLEEILSYARAYRVRVAVENLEHKNDAYMMTRPEEFSRLSETFPEVEVLLDLGHLKIASHRLCFGIEDFIFGMRCKIAGIHLHENDGLSDRHLEPLKGNIMRYLALLPHTNIILECRNMDLPGIIRNLTAIGRYCGET